MLAHRAGEAGLKSMVSISLLSVHEIMRAISNVLWLFNCWTFQVSFVVCTNSFNRGRLIQILEGLGGQAGCHMYWALGSQRSLFGWFVLCLVGASRRCYLGGATPICFSVVRLAVVRHGRRHESNPV